MKIIRRTILLLGLVALGASAAYSGTGCDETMGLRKDCVTQNAKPLPAPQYSEQYPGSSTKLPRNYMDSPPRIPHNIDGLEITKDMNPCMGCHQGGMPQATQIPESHKTSPQVVIQKGKGAQVTTVKGYKADKKNVDPSRHFCMTCHVPQAGNLAPLVKNNF